MANKTGLFFFAVVVFLLLFFYNEAFEVFSVWFGPAVNYKY